MEFFNIFSWFEKIGRWGIRVKKGITMWFNLPKRVKALEDKTVNENVKYCPNPGCGKQLRVSDTSSANWYYRCDICHVRFIFPVSRKVV